MIYLKMLALATFLTTMVACNPLIGVSSFVHSLATGNTLGIVTGGAGLAIEKKTGKTPLEHIMKETKEKPKPVPKDSKLEWSFERLSTVMNQYD